MPVSVHWDFCNGTVSFLPLAVESVFLLWVLDCLLDSSASVSLAMVMGGEDWKYLGMCAHPSFCHNLWWGNEESGSRFFLCQKREPATQRAHSSLFSTEPSPVNDKTTKTVVSLTLAWSSSGRRQTTVLFFSNSNYALLPLEKNDMFKQTSGSQCLKADFQINGTIFIIPIRK